MTIKPHLLVVAVISSSVMGAAIGALAASATSTQASPAAIASAVQHVTDTKAERLLRLIAIESEELTPIKRDIEQLVASTEAIKSLAHANCENGRITAIRSGGTVITPCTE